MRIGEYSEGKRTRKNIPRIKRKDKAKNNKAAFKRRKMCLRAFPGFRSSSAKGFAPPGIFEKGRSGKEQERGIVAALFA